jgi:hypothetical protein
MKESRILNSMSPLTCRGPALADYRSTYSKFFERLKVKMLPCLIKEHFLKKYGGVEI